MNTFHYGENLRRLRKSSSMTQESMAEQLGISQASYSRLEQQSVMRDPRVSAKVAKILKIEPAALRPPRQRWASGIIPIIGEAGFNRKMRAILHSSIGVMVVIGGLAAFVSLVFDLCRGFLPRVGASETTVEWVSWTAALSALVYIYYAFKNIRTEE